MKNHKVQHNNASIKMFTFLIKKVMLIVKKDYWEKVLSIEN